LKQPWAGISKRLRRYEPLKLSAALGRYEPLKLSAALGRSEPLKLSAALGRSEPLNYQPLSAFRAAELSTTFGVPSR
jgi:hypothetical protein